MQERAGQFGAEHTSAPCCITAPCWRVEGVVFDVQFNCLFFFFAPHQCSHCAVSSVHNFHDNWLSEKSVSSNLNLFQKVSHRCYRSLALCGHTVCSSSTFCLTLCYFYICSLHIVRFTCVWEIALFKSFVLSTQWLVNQTIIFWGTKEFGQLT